MPEGLAKLQWTDPQTGVIKEFVLTEGASATIGRLSSNDICIPEQHVSRQHAIIQYEDGIFMLTDLDSANGVFVNDERISEPFPLAAGDEIRLFVPTILFLAADEQDLAEAEITGTVISAKKETGHGKLIITNGPQEGQSIALLLDEVVIGRATTNAAWQILLQDPSVSRPHARMERVDGTWIIRDLGSANGTGVNNVPVSEKGRPLKDGDTITIGASKLIYRAG